MGRPIVMTNHLRRRRREEKLGEECSRMSRETILAKMPPALVASLPKKGEEMSTAELLAAYRENEYTKLYG